MACFRNFWSHRSHLLCYCSSNLLRQYPLFPSLIDPNLSFLRFFISYTKMADKFTTSRPHPPIIRNEPAPAISYYTPKQAPVAGTAKNP
jgi:hypothetical protein